MGGRIYFPHKAIRWSYRSNQGQFESHVSRSQDRKSCIAPLKLKAVSH